MIKNKDAELKEHKDKLADEAKLTKHLEDLKKNKAAAATKPAEKPAAKELTAAEKAAKEKADKEKADKEKADKAKPAAPAKPLTKAE